MQVALSDEVLAEGVLLAAREDFALRVVVTLMGASWVRDVSFRLRYPLERTRSQGLSRAPSPADLPLPPERPAQAGGRGALAVGGKGGRGSREHEAPAGIASIGAREGLQV